MGFWTPGIFFPVFTALLTISVVREAYQYGMYRWSQSRQAKMQKEVESRIREMVATGKLPSPEAMGNSFPGMMPGPMGFPVPPPELTTSGESQSSRDFRDTGQYI